MDTIYNSHNGYDIQLTQWIQYTTNTMDTMYNYKMDSLRCATYTTCLPNWLIWLWSKLTGLEVVQNCTDDRIRMISFFIDDLAIVRLAGLHGCMITTSSHAFLLFVLSQSLISETVIDA